jgi:hypothetical protein
MLPSSDLLLQIESYHELGETIKAAEFLIKAYDMEHPNLKGFELRKKAKPNYILMTAEGNFGEKQIIRIPENTFQFELVLMLNLIAHEMIHVEQKSYLNKFPDRNEREWQAYYEMLFHKVYPQVPNASTFHRKFFANKAFEYYNRMEKDGELQRKYASQKAEIEQLLKELK